MKKLAKVILTFVGLMALSQQSGAASNKCSAIFSDSLGKARKVIQTSIEDQREMLKELSALEVRETSEHHLREKAIVANITALELPAKDFEVKLASEGASEVRDALAADGANILYFLHPWNESSSVPYYNQPTTRRFPGFFTASRSMFILIKNKWYSIKLPTNYVHGELQEEKTDMSEEIRNAVILSENIVAKDEIHKPEMQFIVLKEIASVASKKGDKNQKGNGFTIRDISLLVADKSKQFIPGFLFSKYFKNENDYAVLVARLQVTLLLRYGFVSEYPHGQNILFEINRANGKPTGRLAFRDISDVVFVKAFVEAMSDQIKGPKNNKTVFGHVVMDYPSSLGLDKTTVFNNDDSLKMIYEREFYRYLQKQLGISIFRIPKMPRPGDEEFWIGGDEVIGQYLNTAEGKAVLKSYYEKLHR